MVKLFQEVSRRHNLWTTFSDFLELSSISISNCVDMRNYSRREQRYFEIIKKYTKDELKIFPKLLIELTKALENDVTDVLGELFMELELGNSWKGQFFTPYHVCLATVHVSFDEKNIKRVINEKGFVSLNEPAVGGGAMIIAFAQVMKEKGYNPQQQLKVICNDLDIKSVFMTYIQLSLLGIPAVVYHMNTLTLECYDEWKTPFWILGGWDYKKEKEPVNFELIEEDDGQIRLV